MSLKGFLFGAPNHKCSQEEGMKITCSSLLPGAKNARGTAVIIDVFRAFTCLPLMFSLGIDKAILASSTAEALELRIKNPDLILIGEVGGVPVAGFDFGNSPSQILHTSPGFFKNETIVQRTSAGVQGALAALAGADEVLLGSYGLARSTVQYIVLKQPEEVSLVAMGWDLKEKAPEDEWCARYIAHLLGAGDYDHFQALREIIFHETTQKFLRRDAAHFPAEDPIICLQRDIFDFLLKVCCQDDLVVVKKVVT
jgi:2-phosphosulfolactate phosphatase